MTEFVATALLLATFGGLLLICALLGRTVERLGLPIVFVFLALGMLAGSEGIGGIHFDDYQFAFRLGTIALILILLDGGLNTPLQTVRRSLAPAGLLATIGVLLTAALMALCARALGLSWAQAILLGAVVSSTDAAAVFAVLRGSGLRLSARVGTTIELESGINDPMAVILTLVAVEWFSSSEATVWQALIDVPVQLGIGLAIGLLAGYATRLLLLRLRLSTAGLYPVLTLGLALLAYGAATLLQGSGFLAVFVAAMVLGNTRIPYRGGLARSHDALAWLAQVAMFLMLGLLVFPSQLLPLAGIGILIALFLAVVARPVAVVLCLLPFRFRPREVAYISWVGLRGAVPIILATIPVMADVAGSGQVFNLVFFVVVVSALIPGSTIRWVTRRLGLEAPEQPQPLAALEVTSTRLLSGDLMSFHVTDSLAVCGATLAQIPFPAASAAVLVVRGEELLAARGGTKLEAGDRRVAGRGVHRGGAGAERGHRRVSGMARRADRPRPSGNGAAARPQAPWLG